MNVKKIIIGGITAITIGLAAAPTAHAQPEPPPPPDPCLWMVGTPPPPPAVCPVLHSPGFPMPIFNIGIFPTPAA